MVGGLEALDKICIDGCPLDLQQGRTRGIGSYVDNFLHGLQNENANLSQFAILRFAKRGMELPFDTWHLPFSKIPEQILWTVGPLAIGPYLTFKNIKLFHSTLSYTTPLSGHFRFIATVHDLIPLIYYDQYMRTRGINAKISYKYYLKRLKRADHLIAVSDQTKRDCVSYLGIPESRITTIYHGIDTNLFQRIQNEELLESVKKKYSLPSKFFLYVGGADFRKNVIRLVNAFGKIANSVEEDLVLVGQWYPEWISTLQNQLQSLGIQQRVHFLSFVETQDLACLYTLTTALLFPSLYEGFGLPVLEAFSCQTPVLCSNNSSLIEIANDCAVLVDPYQEEDIAQGILKITQDEKLRQELSVKGYSRSKDFSIDKMTKETIEVYKKVLGV